MKNFSWKLILVFAVIIAAIIYVLPTFKPGLWPYKQINLGLDLQGGMHLVLEVDTAKAIEGQVERISQEIFEQLKKKADSECLPGSYQWRQNCGNDS